MSFNETKMENQTPQSFSAPRHWIAPEELNSSYWADSKNVEKRGQEFHDKPVEAIALIDKLDTKGLARREFLTIMGASMAMAGFACARRPVHKIIPYVVKPDEVTPGIANYYASSDPETGAGLLVKVREGRPVKLEGNPDHPVNRGKLSARQQSAILDLYDPERLQDPQTVDRASGKKSVATWADVDARVVVLEVCDGEALDVAPLANHALSERVVGPERAPRQGVRVDQPTPLADPDAIIRCFPLTPCASTLSPLTVNPVTWVRSIVTPALSAFLHNSRRRTSRRAPRPPRFKAKSDKQLSPRNP
jgi:hypothetical protein